jgi:hypothetical protein
MAITHATALRDTLCNAAVDAIDAGGTGTLLFKTGTTPGAGDEVATLTFSATAFGASSSGTATAAAITSDTDATGGTVGHWEIRNGSATPIIFGLAGTTGSDINLSSLTVGAGDTVSISALTYTAAP